MKKTIFIYALILGGVIILLKAFEYKYWIHDLSVEVYLAIVAALFTGFGIWIGLRFIRQQKPAPSTHPAPVPPAEKIPFSPAPILESLGISKREQEVLELMAAGHSNQEIANGLHISIHTVKTHSSNLYRKLDVQRRTQAIQKAKELKIIA